MIELIRKLIQLKIIARSIKYTGTNSSRLSAYVMLFVSSFQQKTQPNYDLYIFY